MSGHLLSSVNPQAAQTEDFEVPPVGARVQYFARPGQGRGPTTVFAADVLHANPRTGACELWVLFGREDYRDFVNVRQRSDQEPYHCWDYLPDGFDKLADDLDAANGKIDALEKAIFGDYKRPTNADGSPKSVIDILAEFEQKVFAATGVAAPASPKRSSR